MIRFIQVLIVSVFMSFGLSSFAEETVGEKVREAGSEVKKDSKQAYRNAKDEMCEWVNGKMECAGKKVKNKTENAKDEVKDAVDAE